LITLTTDFGLTAPYVAAMKGALLGVCPAARILDLSHQIRPQDVRHAAYFLAVAVPAFPPEALHVVVVDPGVGTDRSVLYIESTSCRLLAPDNGCWTQIDFPAPPVVRRLTEARFWRHPVSATFHGRDIFAPVAGHLARGIHPAELGPVIDGWVTLSIPRPRLAENGELVGEVLFIDDFGNVITNIPGGLLRTGTFVRIGAREIRQLVRTYGDARPGELVALVSSCGHLELAVVQGNAAANLAVAVGAPVRLVQTDGNTGKPPASTS
jgi:S-adenosylmethionine hydrolase